MDPNTQRLFEAAAGGAAGFLGVEDVFNTWLYTGNASTQTITNGIDLAGEGGMVWFKQRDTPDEFPAIVDTERGRTKVLYPSDSYAEFTTANSSTHDLISFNSDGFTLGTVEDINANFSTKKNVSWTFRKAPGFFDVVTWTGDGSSTGQVISHNLGSTPGFIVVKERNGTAWWTCWHRSLGGARIFLNDTSPSTTANIQLYFGDGTSYVAPTDSSFTVNSNDLNQSGNTYVAYIFAHDDAQFGENSDESIIKCGSLTGSGPGATTTVNLGWEPQWILAKRTDAAQNWILFDNMRGLDLTNAARLYPNATSSESVSTPSGYFRLTPTGFIYGPDNYMGDTAQIIYIAIRRGPMKTPEAGTDVFALEAVTATYQNEFNTGFPVDMTIAKYRSGSNRSLDDRLRGYNPVGGTNGYPQLKPDSAGAEVTTNAPFIYASDSNTSVRYGINVASADLITWAFRRAPGFFDVVAYTGTGVARTVDHNLSVAPELMIVKRRESAAGWSVYSQFLGNTDNLRLDEAYATFSSVAVWNNTSPTSTVFTVGTDVTTNANTSTYIAYLFATLPGISKVGSYTGTGSTLNVDCGFTAGARFVLIKRTDSSGGWYVWDSARGITAGNDPYLLLNSTAAEVTGTNYIDTLSSGFQITSSAPAAINASGGSFIFLAVA
jgi:hypothetical protein